MSLALASSISVLGLERVCLRWGYPWPWPRIFFCVLGLEPCVLNSTSGPWPRIFLCPWPWLRAEFPRLHLCFFGTETTFRQTKHQRWSRGHKARGQGQGHKKNPRPRPRTAFPRTNTLEAKDRNAQGQGPRTQTQVLSKKKRTSQKFFKRSHKKTFSKKIFKRFTKF